MDCFFASATAVGRPEFQGLPVAVCHSASERGSGEVSTANYEVQGGFASRLKHAITQQLWFWIMQRLGRVLSGARAQPTPVLLYDC